MELFIPSVLLLLFTAGVVFFILPRFGAPVLAVISVALLVFGIYQHMNAFGTEYRLSTWQVGLTAYAPFILVGGLILVIAFYLVSLMTSGGSTAPNIPEMPTVADMPTANTATNAVTAGVNNALKGITNVAGNAAAGIANVAKPNNKSLAAAPLAAVNQVASVANTALQNVGKVANQAVTGVTNAVTGITNAITGVPKNNKPANGGLLGGNKGSRVPGLNFPLSQV